MVIVDKKHVSEELKNSIFEMGSSATALPAPSTDLIVITPSVDSDYGHFAEHNQADMKSLAVTTGQLTLDTDFVYRNHSQVGQLDQPSPVTKPLLLEMDDNMLSSYGYKFSQAVDQSGFAGKLYNGQGLRQGPSFAQCPAFGQAQLDFNQVSYAFNAQSPEITQGCGFNVKAPEFTPRLSQQVPASSVHARRTKNLGNGVYFKPAQLLRTSTDPDKDWV